MEPGVRTNKRIKEKDLHNYGVSHIKLLINLTVKPVKLWRVLTLIPAPRIMIINARSQIQVYQPTRVQEVYA